MAAKHKFASESDVVDKFTKLTRGILSQTRIDCIATLVLGCDRLDDMDDLVRALALHG